MPWSLRKKFLVVVTLIALGIYVYSTFIDTVANVQREHIVGDIYLAYGRMNNYVVTPDGIMFRWFWFWGENSGTLEYISIEDGLPLSEVIQDVWNRAYIFEPGTTRAEIESVIGFEDNRLMRVVREGFTQILFIDDTFSRSILALNLHAREDFKFDLGEFNENGYIKIYRPELMSFENVPRVVVERCEDCEKIVVRKIS